MPGGTASNIVAYIARGDMVSALTGCRSSCLLLRAALRVAAPRGLRLDMQLTHTATVSHHPRGAVLSRPSVSLSPTNLLPPTPQPLSIMMTTASTMMAVFTTPLLTSLLVSA